MKNEMTTWEIAEELGVRPGFVNEVGLSLYPKKEHEASNILWLEDEIANISREVKRVTRGSFKRVLTQAQMSLLDTGLSKQYFEITGGT